MNDFDSQVRRRLQGLRLQEPEREEVFAEIAMHLESIAEELKAGGLSDEDASRQALLHLGNDRRLLRGIQKAKEGAMRDSFRKVWLPGAVVVLLVYWSQMIIYRFFPVPSTYHILGTYYAYSWGWFVAEICAGAFGAWWCREVGGSVRERLIVALAPAEAMCVVIALALSVDSFMQLVVQRRTPYFVSHPLILVAGILWMLHPAVPSILGALAFLRGGERAEATGSQSTSRMIPNNS